MVMFIFHIKIYTVTKISKYPKQEIGFLSKYWKWGPKTIKNYTMIF